MKLYRLNNKLVLRLTPKAGEFLKAYSSNTLGKPRNAFLDIQGKIIATFDQCPLNDDEVFIVIEKQFLNPKPSPRSLQFLQHFFSSSGV